MAITYSTLSTNSANNGAGIDNYGTLSINNSTLSENPASEDAGGIFNESGGTATVTNSTLNGNSAVNFGGAFENAGTLYLYNSTLYGNSGIGGGIENDSGGTATIINSTLAGNTGEGAGGIFSSGGTVTLENTLLANAPSADCFGAITAGPDSQDLDGTCGSATVVMLGQLNLGPLQDNGGYTQTVELMLGSVAINAGNNAYSIAAGLVYDQRGRGFPRIVSGTVDVGAYEYQMCIEP